MDPKTAAAAEEVTLGGLMIGISKTACATPDRSCIFLRFPAPVDFLKYLYAGGTLGGVIAVAEKKKSSLGTLKLLLEEAGKAGIPDAVIFFSLKGGVRSERLARQAQARILALQEKTKTLNGPFFLRILSRGSSGNLLPLVLARVRAGRSREADGHPAGR